MMIAYNFKISKNGILNIHAFDISGVLLLVISVLIIIKK